MSVLFLTEGGTDYGMGHIGRCEAVAQALAEYWLESVFMIDAPQDFIPAFPYEAVYFDWKREQNQFKKEFERLRLLNNILPVYLASFHVTGAIL